MSPPALSSYSSADWTSALDALLTDVHPVDRDATRIWWAFYPLPLADAFATAPDDQTLTRRLRLDGNPRLVAGQIGTSHRFLYGHRYWPLVTRALIAHAERVDARGAVPLAELAQTLIAEVAAAAGADAGLVTGITLVGLMTLRQVGLEAFRASAAGTTGMTATPRQTPDAIVARRARDDGQGPLGFLRSTKRFTVVFDESAADATFPIIDSQHLTTASAADGRDYLHGPRRFQEGPIPAQCRSATCGTCWVGVLGGREKLNAIEPYEARKLEGFGYLTVQETHPVIRLACQARASGNVTIVIPPWHGFVSRLQPPQDIHTQTGAHP